MNINLFKKSLILLSSVLIGCSGNEVLTNSEVKESSSENLLSVRKAIPNPNGNLEELYVLSGDTTKPINGLDESLVKLPNFDLNKMDNKTINVYHLNDIHGKITNYSSKGNTHNFAQMVKIIKDHKEGYSEDELAIFLSAGDDHIGSPFDDLLGTSMEDFVMSASYNAFSHGGLDFSVLGNHELDKKSEVFISAVNENAKFTVLSSNIKDSQYELPVYPAAIGIVNGVKIGFIGLTTDEDTMVNTDIDPTLSLNKPEEILKNVLPIIEKHADFIVILSHVGFDQSNDRYTLETGDSKFAEIVGNHTEKPAIVVGGHTHTKLNENSLDDNNIFNGVPVVQAGDYGNFLGHVTFDLSHNGNYFETNEINAKLIPTLRGDQANESGKIETKDDYDIEFQETIIDPMRILLDEKLKEVVGITKDEKLISDEINVVDRYIGESALANYMNDLIVERSKKFPTGKVDFSIFNATGIRGLKQNEEITFEDIYSIMPYADELFIVEVTGRELLKLIENNVPRIYKKEELITYGGELNPIDFLERGYLHFSSDIRYEIELSDNPLNNKVINLTLNGKKINDVLDEKYTLALSSYLVIGRGGWNGESVGQGLPEEFIGYNIKALAEKSHDTGLILRSEIIEYIKNDSNGIIGQEQGVKKDGRVNII